MKRHFFVLMTVLSCSMAGLPQGRAQVILNPNVISGTIRFTNVNPAILSLLKAPGNEGMSNLIVLATVCRPRRPLALIRAICRSIPAPARCIR